MTNAAYGFQGEITGLSLADVIQIKGQNRYSGCISVEYRGGNGNIYFENGNIVHVVHADQVGEEALYTILSWPGGSFSILPDLKTDTHTISGSLNFLLLEAHRRIDENTHATKMEIETDPQSETLADIPPNIHIVSLAAAKVMALGGVTYSVLSDKQNCLPIQDSSNEAKAIAKRSLLLAQSSTRLGDRLGLGNMKYMVLQNKQFGFMQLEGLSHYLSIVLEAGQSFDELKAKLWAVFSSRSRPDMEGLLHQVTATNGVLAGTLHNELGEIVATASPKTVDGEPLAEEAAALMGSLHSLQVADGLLELELVFAGGRFLIKTLSGAYISLLCLNSINKPIINMTLNLALPKLQQALLYQLKSRITGQS